MPLIRKKMQEMANAFNATQVLLVNKFMPIHTYETRQSQFTIVIENMD